MKYKCPQCGEDFEIKDVELRGGFLLPFWGNLQKPIQEVYPVECLAILACPNCNEPLLEDEVSLGNLPQNINISQEAINKLVQKLLEKLSNTNS